MIETDFNDEKQSVSKSYLVSKSVNKSMARSQRAPMAKRNITPDYRNFKIDDNKLLEANRKKVILFQYLAKISKEKKIIKEKNCFVDVKQKLSTKRPKTNEEILKNRETRRGKRLLQNKKKKKEEKKKQKKQKNNFMTSSNYLKNFVYDDYDINHLKEIKNWTSYLKEKVKRIFPPHALNVDFLIKQLEILFNIHPARSIDSSLNELGKIRNFKGVEIKTNKYDTDDEDNSFKRMDNETIMKIIEEQKKLLEALTKKESNFLKSKDEASNFLTNMKGYESALKDKNFYLMQSYMGNTPMPMETPGQDQGLGHGQVLKPMIEENKEDKSPIRNNRDDKSPVRNNRDDKSSIRNNRDDKRESIVALDPIEADKLKERVINFTLKTFDKFSLKRIVEYWIDNCDKLQEKKSKELSYKYQADDQKEEENDERERKKKTKATNVKHIYSTPTNEVLQIIPFCSKKYTIQKKVN